MANKAEMKELMKLVRAQQKQVELLTAQIKNMEGKSKKNPVNLAQESDVEGEKGRRRSPRIAKKNKKPRTGEKWGAKFTKLTALQSKHL